MNWIKSAIVGAVASLAMFLLIQLAIETRLSGLAGLYGVFNVPPSAALLIKLGLPAKPLALIIHFLYGIAGSLILTKLYWSRINVVRGMGLSVVLWLILMLVYSPIIGWGLFGFGASASELPVDHPRHLGAPLKYIYVTLFVHLVYGMIVGWTNRRWLVFKD